jgi:hypothetical protein
MIRREFIKNSSLGLASLSLAKYSPSPVPLEVPLKALHSYRPSMGLTWGTPWAKGQVKKGQEFLLHSSEGTVSVQTWPLAYWPDGSLKWTAHALGGESKLGENPRLIAGKASQGKIVVRETPTEYLVNTGKIEVRIPKSGNYLISTLQRDGKEMGRNALLDLRVQDRPSAEFDETVRTTAYTSHISKVSLEQQGSTRSTFKVEGIHKNASGTARLPFTVRMYLFSNSDTLRMVHTLIYDADENREFISGIGLKFEVNFHGEEWHNRHVRFTGEGVFAEAVRGLTGLRRDPGKAIRDAQVEGKRTGEITVPTVSSRMQYIAAFGEYSLYQGNSDGFILQKRTQSGHSWIDAAQGKRATGTAYMGSPAGGIALGLKDFWQNYPAQIDLKKGTEAYGEMTLWMWAPRAQAMDLRFYHDGMGQDTYPKQLEGLEINYEDYEPGFGTPEGVAKTNEIFLQVLPCTPDNTALMHFAEQVQKPPLFVSTPSYMRKVGAFGGAFPVLENNSTGKRKEIEEQLDFYFTYYQRQVEEHRWYGFWNYGDFMHSYDSDRHVWKYDIGGFAWDNSELSTDIWLWTYFLSTGNPEVFRLAEAMTRHTGEVDVHHTGKFAPLGSRHNVMHWGCSAKQLRISTAANRRYYYYLTGDERTGDLMREQIDAVKTLQTIVPIRKVNSEVPKNTENSEVASVGFGTDWGAIAAAWLTEWERTQDPRMKTKLLNSMDTLAAQPKGFFTGLQFMNLNTGKFTIDKTGRLSVSHLSAVFGLPEICFELLQSIEHPGFEKVWLQYCTLYNASSEEQEKALGEPLKRLNLQQGHARLTAYAAFKKGDKNVGKRAWMEFYKGEGGFKTTSRDLVKILPPDVLSTRTENPGISTNAVAQWGLAALQCLAFTAETLE